MKKIVKIKNIEDKYCRQEEQEKCAEEAKEENMQEEEEEMEGWNKDDSEKYVDLEGKEEVKHSQGERLGIK